MSVSATAPSASTASDPPGRQPTVTQRGEPRLECPGVPAAHGPVECVRPGSGGLVRAALPVDEVVARFVARPRPVGELVAVEPGGGQAVARERVLVRRAIVVLVGPCPVAPAPCAVGDRQMVAAGARQALRVGIVERQGVRGDVVRRQRDAPPRASAPNSRRSGPARRRAGRG